MSATSYLHGTSDEEQARLALMNDILNERELALLALSGDERCLEVGAGTGVFARALARAVPRGSVVAIERDPRQLAAGARNAGGVPNLELRRGDATDPPLAEGEWGSFDLVHARFLLEHLSAPEAAVRAMVRAVAPGRRIVLVDDDHAQLCLWPEVEGFAALWRAYCRQYELRGTDPRVGRRLCQLLVDAGARVSATAVLFYGGASGVPGFEAVVENLIAVVGGAAGAIVESRELGESAVERVLLDLRAWSRRAGAALWYALPVAEGTRGT